MKKINIILYLLSVLFLLSCEDNLDLEPKGVVPPQDAFQTPGDAINALSGAYQPLSHSFRGSWDWSGGAAIPRGWVIGDVMSDDAVKGGGSLGDQGQMRDLQTFNAFPSNSDVLSIWRYSYKGIVAANLIINLPEISGLDAALRTRMIGEAHFLRALHYFEMVRVFGGVPLVLGTEESVQLFPRNTEAEIWAQIEADLAAAISNLPLKSTYDAVDKWRASKGAAYALRAKVNLYQQKYQECLSDISSAEAEGYALLPNYADNFNTVGELGSESVFEIVHTSGLTPGQGSILNAVFGTRAGVGWGFNEPTQDFVDAFENDDPRLSVTVAIEGEDYLGWNIYESSWSIFTGYNLKKCMLKTDNQGDGPVNFPLIRYADLLLWKAEASLELGTTADALSALEMVRARARALANNPATALPQVTTTNATALRDAIRHERRVELGFESHRYHDLVRWDIAKDVLQPTAQTSSEKGIDDYGNGWTDKYKYLPIPIREIDINPALEQNPGY